MKRTREIFSKAEFSGALVTDASELFYLTGINLEGYWLFLTKKRAYAFAAALVFNQLKRLLPSVKVIAADKISAKFVEFIKEKKIKSVGVNFEKTSYALAKRLKLNARLVNTGNLTHRFRVVKSEKEIFYIKKACKIASAASRYAKKLAKPGVSEEKIAFKIDEYFAKNGARPAFNTIVASGPNTAKPHHISGKRKIAKNDTLLMDLGCNYKGYCSDLTRTYFLGKISSLQQRVFKAVKTAKALAVNKLKNGAKACEIDKAARGRIKESGFGEQFIHSTGHGVGLEIHEPPRLSIKDKTPLKTGMVVTVEPGIYIENKFGVRLEDTYLIKKKGSEVLTK